MRGWRAIVKQFPSCVFFRIEGKRIYIYSVFHTSQDPKNGWTDWMMKKESRGENMATLTMKFPSDARIH